jgi:hypothetical protein
MRYRQDVDQSAGAALLRLTTMATGLLAIAVVSALVPKRRPVV